LQETLTPRERMVVEQLAEGKGTRQIAEALGLTRGTVIQYMSTIRAKLHMTARQIAVKAARGELG
jgi:DNA-binding NarL/FixJ family response regulator